MSAHDDQQIADDEFRGFATFLAVLGVVALLAIATVIVLAPDWFYATVWGWLR